MSGAFGWGLVAGSAFVVGGLLALIFDIRPKPLGLLMGFGSGALIAAVAYELVDAGGRAVAFVLALAGGSLLAGVATELLPEGRKLAGPLVGSATVIGFALVFALVELA